MKSISSPNAKIFMHDPSVAKAGHWRKVGVRQRGVALRISKGDLCVVRGVKKQDAGRFGGPYLERIEVADLAAKVSLHQRFKLAAASLGKRKGGAEIAGDRRQCRLSVVR